MRRTPMKKTLIVIVAGILVHGFLANQAYGQTADEILEKMIEAQGGRTRLASIKDVTGSGEFEMPAMGMSGLMTRYQKEPNLLRMDVEIMGMMMTQAYDGETAWMVNPQTGMTEEMPEPQAEYFERDTLGFGAILDPEKYGISFAYKGKEKIEDKEYHVLGQSFSDGYTITIYIDQKTYLPYKTKAMTLDPMEMETETESYMSDYREVDGVMTSFQMRIFQGGEEFIVFTASEIKYNTGLEDSFFKMEK
jgi:outer membrane lipoprotein-sorting protein